MKRFLLPAGFLCLIGVFVFTLVRTSRGRVPSLAVPKTSQAVVTKGLSFGCTSGDFPRISYKDYKVEYSTSCNPGGGQSGTNVRGFCQTDAAVGELMDKGRYSWTMPDNVIGAGEFKGVIQYLEENIRRMLEGPDVILMLNGMLCGQGAHAASSSSVSGVNACAAADLCVFDAGKGGFKKGGSTSSNCVIDSIATQTGCYGPNSGGGAGTIYYDSDGNGATDTTWTTLNDGWIVYANKGEAKVWFNTREQKIEALIAIWGDSQAKRIPPLPPVGYGWDQNDPGTTSENGARNWDRVCVEAAVKLCENNPGGGTPNRCPGATGDCGAVFVTSNLDLYADALLIKTKMSIKQDPANPNIIDVCPDFNPSTGGPSQTTTWIELVDQDIEPNLTVSLGVGSCTCEVDPDASFPPDTLNEQLAGLVYDVLSDLLHGTCKGNINLCNPPSKFPLPSCDGSNCTTNPADERCDPCDNNCDNGGGLGGDIDESLKTAVNNYCDWCDTPAEKADNPNGGSTTGWDYCVRGVPAPTGSGAECSVGLLPMDLNNVLGGLLFGANTPVSINDPQYSTVAPDYGTLKLFGVKYDLGCYPQSFDIRSYGCYSNIDAAIYPRWSEYELCADMAEVGEYPNKTNPPPFYFISPSMADYEIVSEPYQWDTPDASWNDITASAKGSGAAITLPFSFPFFSNSYTQLKVFRNGFITFNTGWTTDSEPPASLTIPDTTDPDNVIAVFWRRLRDTSESTESYYSVTEESIPSWTPEGSTYMLRTSTAGGSAACVGIQNDECSCGGVGNEVMDGTNDTTGGNIQSVGNIALNISSFYFFDTNWANPNIDISVNGFISPNNIATGTKCDMTAANTIAVLCGDFTPTFDNGYTQRKTVACDCTFEDDFCWECRKMAYGSGYVRFSNPSAGPFVVSYQDVSPDSCLENSLCPYSDITCTQNCAGCTLGFCRSSSCRGRHWGNPCDNTACSNQRNQAKVKLVDSGNNDQIVFEYGQLPNNPGSLRFTSSDSSVYVQYSPILPFHRYTFTRQVPSASTGYVRWKSYGSPVTSIVISWDGYYPSKGNRLSIKPTNFQVVLYNTGDIVFRYKSISGTDNGVVGIENADGSAGLPVEPPSDSTSFRIRPRTLPPPSYHFAIGLNQDLATEIAYSLYVSSLACNVFDKNSIICDLFGFFGGGGSSEECPFMKVSTQRSVTPGLKLADPDCYVELRMRPAGGPSVRTGAAPYSVTWPAGYPTQTTSGIYDGALFVPNFLYEVRAPLDDGVPGVCSNPPVTVLAYDTNGWGGLDLEYINLYHPMFPDKPGYIHIFLDIGFHLNQIRYSAEYGLSPVEQKDSVNQFIGLLTNIYLATLMNFRIQLPFISDPSDPLTIKFNTARVSSYAFEQMGLEAIDYLPGEWPENTAGDYLAIYGYLEGKLNLWPLIQSLGLLSPPDIRNLEEIEKLYPETFVRLPQWGEDELSTQIELSPYDTARLFEDHTISFNISSYSQDTPSGLMRYTYRLNNGLWSVPKGTSSIKLSYLPDGYYKLEVASIGNKQRMDSTPAVVNFVVDRTPPRVEPLENKTVVRDEVYKFPVFIDDNMTKRENLKTRFRVDNGEWVDFDPRLKYLDIPLKTWGLHDIEIEAYDEAGNRGFYKQGVFRADKGRGFSCGFVASTIKGYAGFFLATLLSVGIPLLFLIGIKVGLKRKGSKNKFM